MIVDGPSECANSTRQVLVLFVFWAGQGATPCLHWVHKLTVAVMNPQHTQGHRQYRWTLKLSRQSDLHLGIRGTEASSSEDK